MPVEPKITRRVVPHGMKLPPPQPGVRYVPVRLVGVVIADDNLRDQIERRFHWPMIILALALLPLLAWELLAPPTPGTWQWWVSAISLAIVWVAFFVEFVVKVAIAECRIEYCKRNWLDMIILAVPLLRPLRVAVVARTSRVFTLRGVAMKLLRYVITIVVGLEATDRLLERIGLKTQDGRPAPETMTRHQLMQEVKRLRRLTDRWEAWRKAHQEYMIEIGHQPFDRPTPTADVAETRTETPAGRDDTRAWISLDPRDPE